MTEALLDRLDRMDRKIDRAARSTIETGTVTAVDKVKQTATVSMPTPEGPAQTRPNIPLFGGFLPEVGQTVTLMVSGTQIMAGPPTDASITAVRGRVETTGGTSLVTQSFESTTELCPVGTFESNTDGWAGTNATLAPTAAQAHGGTQSMGMTAIAAATMTAKVAANGSYLSAVLQKKWYRFTYWARTAVTGRAHTMRIEWLDSTLSVLRTDTTGGGTDSSGSWQQFFMYKAAPASAVWARLSLDIASPAIAELHYVDDVSFREAAAGFDASTNAKVWTFDSGTESWVGSSATLTQYTLADPAPIAGAGSLQCTSTVANAYGATSPTGLSGVPVTAGFSVAYSTWVRGGPTWSTTRNVNVQILWYTAAGASNGSSGSANTTVDPTQWFELSGTFVAPANTAFMAIKVVTTSGAIGEKLYVDVTLVTQPSNTTIDINTNGTYVRTGTASMSMRCLANGVANCLTPPGDDGNYAWAVVPGDYYDVDFYYKNDSGNGTRKAAFMVASWYASGGGFIGTQLGTFPVTTPGTGWVPASETFLVPTNAAFMRINIVYLGSANDILYIDDLSVKKVSVLTGKFLPQGSLDPIDSRYISQAADGVSIITAIASLGNSWTATSQQKIPNPGQPVRVIAMATAFLSGTNLCVAQGRVGISMDNGLSWRYGALEKMSQIPQAGFPAPMCLICVHQVTGMPTDDILYRVEYLSSAAVDVVNLAQWSFVLPAPPAGKQ